MQIEMKTDVFSKRLVIDFIKQETNSKCLYQKGEMDVFEVQRNEISINVWDHKELPLFASASVSSSIKYFHVRINSYNI